MNPTLIHIIHAALLLLLIGPAVWATSRGNRLKYVAIWLLIFTAISWGYQIFAPEDTRFDRMVQERQHYYSGSQTAPQQPEQQTGQPEEQPSRMPVRPSADGDDI